MPQVRGGTLSRKQIQNLWISLSNRDAVCFDVDSTIIRDEDIDRIADFAGVGDRVSAVTKRAMSGEISFSVALHERLNVIKPSRSLISDYMQKHPPRYSQSIKSLIMKLHQRKITVYIISGGFACFVRPIADYLGVSQDNVFCNEIIFDSEENYQTFDESLYTSQPHGKRRIMDEISRYHNNIIMIGDGATDLETAPPATGFIGYGGNVVREFVKENASWYVYHFDELLKVLN